MLFSIYWMFFLFKQKTAYEMRNSDWSSDVCSADLWQEVTAMAESLRQVRPHDPVGLWYLGVAEVNSARDEGRSRGADHRSQQRRGGKEWVTAGGTRWARYDETEKQHQRSDIMNEQVLKEHINSYAEVIFKTN